MRWEPAQRRPAAAFGLAAAASGKDSDEVESLMAALRRHIQRLEAHAPRFDRAPRRGQPWLTGIDSLDRHLAAQGLARAGLHDVAPQVYGDQPAAMGFALALALRRLDDQAERRPLLWCRLAHHEREFGRLYGHGLETLGLPRRRFLTVTLKRPASLLWVMEEALKSGALALVLGDGEATHAGLTATRRLALAAAAGKSAGLLLFAGPDPPATASASRWRIAAAPSDSAAHDRDAPGHPVWQVELTRARGGRPGAWTLEWQHAPHRFALVSGLRGGTLHPWTDEGAPRAAPAAPALRAG
jgi:protein ImuA